MGAIKREIFSDKQNEIALYSKLLAHPARVAILEDLFELKACRCGNLVEKIGLAQPTISQHLKELKQMGLIKGRVEGTSVCYCINEEIWNKMKSMLFEFLSRDVVQADCC